MEAGASSRGAATRGPPRAPVATCDAERAGILCSTSQGRSRHIPFPRPAPPRARGEGETYLADNPKNDEVVPGDARLADRPCTRDANGTEGRDTGPPTPREEDDADAPTHVAPGPPPRTPRGTCTTTLPSRPHAAVPRAGENAPEGSAGLPRQAPIVVHALRCTSGASEPRGAGAPVRGRGGASGESLEPPRVRRAEGRRVRGRARAPNSRTWGSAAASGFGRNTSPRRRKKRGVTVRPISRSRSRRLPTFGRSGFRTQCSRDPSAACRAPPRQPASSSAAAERPVERSAALPHQHPKPQPRPPATRPPPQPPARAASTSPRATRPATST